MDDGEILAGLQARDPAGLAAAYDRYAAPLYGYCRWMLRDPGQAAKVLRETFAVAAKVGGAPKDAGELRAWLYGVTRDQGYRRLRTAEPGFDEIPGEAGWDGHPAGAGHANGASHSNGTAHLNGTAQRMEPATRMEPAPRMEPVRRPSWPRSGG